MKTAAAHPHAASSAPLRLLTAVPICEGHDSAITTLNLEFIRHGFEVGYLGYHRSARDIVRAAIQEDVRAIGRSSYLGGHVEFFTEVRALLEERGAKDIGLFGGGGGNVFAQLLETVECCSLGQITRRLHDLVGHYRPAI